MGAGPFLKPKYTKEKAGVLKGTMGGETNCMHCQGSHAALQV